MYPYVFLVHYSLYLTLNSVEISLYFEFYLFSYDQFLKISICCNIETFLPITLYRRLP